MKLKRCKRGHYYDEDKFAMCPHCSSKKIEANKTVQIKDNVDKEITRKKNDAQGDGKALKDAVKEVLEQKKENETEEYQKRSISDVNKNPVGMLVLTEGDKSGTMISLCSGDNYVGSSEQGELVVTRTIKKETMYYAKIQYMEVDNSFIIHSLQSQENILVNGSIIEKEIMLNAYDKIRILNSQLLFIPICGKHFKWE